MQVIFSAFGGALTLTKQGDILTLAWDETLGGGLAAGILTGKGALILNGNIAIPLGEKLINSHVPASVLPLVTVIEGVAAQALAAL